jgi:hypothetical protein
MVQRGTRVTFRPPTPAKRSASGQKGEEKEHIPGVWWTLDKSPGGWWLMPIDLLAKAWAEHHSDRLTNGCLDAPARRLQQYFG